MQKIYRRKNILKPLNIRSIIEQILGILIFE